MTDALANSGLVIVDKPAGMTSHDVVGRLRRYFHTKKVGHAGTLDPMATGVLVLGLERGTKFLAHMVASTKSYDATIRLGAATTTDDAEGEHCWGASAAGVDRTAIETENAKLTGDIMQKPAAVSAIKINGRRAHELVREGQEVDIPARPVTVDKFDVLAERREDNYIDLDVTVDCSSGTYIRSLARDLGEALQVGGHLTALRRTKVGPFVLAYALSLDALAESPRLSLSLDEALARCFPVLSVTEDEADEGSDPHPRVGEGPGVGGHLQLGVLVGPAGELGLGDDPQVVGPAQQVVGTTDEALPAHGGLVDETRRGVAQGGEHLVGAEAAGVDDPGADLRAQGGGDLLLVLAAEVAEALSDRVDGGDDRLASPETHVEVDEQAVLALSSVAQVARGDDRGLRCAVDEGEVHAPEGTRGD